MLYDIFCVHSVFLFANYQYKQYQNKEFLLDINDDNLTKNNNLQYIDFKQKIDFYPSYLINDNLMNNEL